MTTSARDFDIIVWGATGFTGSLVAEYLAERYGSDRDLRWALGGRNPEKLRALRDSLGAAGANLELVTGDSFDTAAVDAIARRTRTVISTVGPYAKYGSPLVEACVRHGTHYCDLAGEAQWIRQMIDEHHERAQQTGARIVHCCGFDSVPMDIGVWFLQHEAMQRHGAYLCEIEMLVKATKGGVSGGTMASMMNVVRESRADRVTARIVVAPYSLNPPGERDGPDDRDQSGIRYDDIADAWTAPFIMAGINTKVVRRSHALAGYPYGRDFRYREAVMTGDGVSGWMKAAAITGGVGGLVLAASFGPTRSLVERFLLPDPGEGPDAETREHGFFNLRQYGRLADGSVMRSRITGDRDPGYGSTSRMLSECALCLATDDLDSPGGVLTPASAMAAPLLGRLREHAGLSFEILDRDPPGADGADD